MCLPEGSEYGKSCSFRREAVCEVTGQLVRRMGTAVPNDRFLPYITAKTYIVFKNYKIIRSYIYREVMVKYRLTSAFIMLKIK